MKPLTQFEKMRVNRRKLAESRLAAELMPLRYAQPVIHRRVGDASGPLVVGAQAATQLEWLKTLEQQ